MKMQPQLPQEDWNTFYQDVPADEVPWELGGPSYELTQVISENVLIPPARVLDLGCGLGSQSIFLAKQGFEVVGVDIAESAIAKAKKLAQFANVPVTFQTTDVTSLPFSSETFDIVYDRGCFQHLKPAEQFRYRSEVSRVTTEGGTFLLVVFAQTLSARELETFFGQNFTLYEEEVYTATEKGTDEMITFRSVLFEKHALSYGELN